MGQCDAAAAATTCAAAQCTALAPCATFACTNLTSGQLLCSATVPSNDTCSACCALAGCAATAVPSASTATTIAPSPGTSNATASPPGGVPATAAPTGPAGQSPFAACDLAADASVNLLFTAMSRLPSDLDVLRREIAEAAGVVTGRVVFTTRHGQHGTPFGNTTLLPVVFVSSALLGDCSVSNVAAVANFSAACNSDVKPPALVELKLFNCTIIPVGAKVHVFPVLSTTDQVYLVVYVGIALMYAAFTAYVVQKFVLASYMEAVERAKAEKEAARLGLPPPGSSKDNGKKKLAPAAKGGRKAPPPAGRGGRGGRGGGGGGRGHPSAQGDDGPLLVMPTATKNAGGADEVDEEQQAVMFGSTDADEQSRHMMAEVVRTLTARMSPEFAVREMRKYQILNAEMTPVVNPRLLQELDAIEMPPVSSSLAPHQADAYYANREDDARYRRNANTTPQHFPRLPSGHLL